MKQTAFLDAGSYATIVITLVLFVVALFVKGFTHDLLLEAGVFLVSVKLVLMGYKSSLAADQLRQELERIRQAVEALRHGTDQFPQGS